MLLTLALSSISYGQVPLPDHMMIPNLVHSVPHQCVGVLVVEGERTHRSLEARRHHLYSQLLRVYFEGTVAAYCEGKGHGRSHGHWALHKEADSFVGVQDGLGCLHFNYAIISYYSQNSINCNYLFMRAVIVAILTAGMWARG